MNICFYTKARRLQVANHLWPPQISTINCITASTRPRCEPTIYDYLGSNPPDFTTFRASSWFPESLTKSKSSTFHLFFPLFRLHIYQYGCLVVLKLISLSYFYPYSSLFKSSSFFLKHLSLHHPTICCESNNNTAHRAAYGELLGSGDPMYLRPRESNSNLSPASDLLSLAGSPKGWSAQSA